MLRLSLIFEIPQLEIPIYYRTAFVSLIKKTLEGTEYFDLYYRRKFPKPFTFSVFLPIERISSDRILLRKPIKGLPFLKLFISSTDAVLLLQIVASLGEIKTYSWRNEIKLRFLKADKTLPPPKVEDGSLLIRTMSPIFLRSKDGRALFPPKPQEENFEEKLKEFNREFNEIHRRIFETLKLPYREVKVIPLSWKRRVVKLRFREVENLLVEAFDGKFALYGDEETLKALYYKGIGNRTSEGFGMVDNWKGIEVES